MVWGKVTKVVKDTLLLIFIHITYGGATFFLILQHLIKIFLERI